MNARAQNDDTQDGDILPPNQALTEQTLAVDLARVETAEQIATAHRFPRSIDVFIKKVQTMACYNQEAAENCVYALPRGGKPIIGPSIGFANIVAQAWGNCIDGARMSAIDRKEKVVIAEGVFHDLESNRKTVVGEQRRIVDSRGRLFSDDMIIVTSKAAGSIARRNAILNAVPRALWHPIWEKALQIVRGTAETFAERKDAALKAFAQFGIKPDQIVAYIGLKGDADLTLEHIPNLRGLYAALRDQTITAEEILDPRRQGNSGFERVENPLADEGAPAPQQATASGQENAAGAATEDDDADIQEEATGNSTRPRKAKNPGQKPTRPKAAEPVPQTPPQPVVATPIPAAPKNTDEYRTHALIWIAAGTSVSAIEDQWRSERGLRTNCMVVEDAFEEIKKAKDERVAKLKAA